MTENSKQVEIQPALQSAVTTNKHEKLLKLIKRISIAVIVASFISFSCGIANSLIYYSIWHAVWCPLLISVVGILGILDSKNVSDGVYVTCTIIGTLLSFLLLGVETAFVVLPSFERWNEASYGLGIFIVILACVLSILLITLTVLGFMRGGCCGYSKEKVAAQQVVYLQSSNVQQGISVVPQNQHFVVQPNIGNQPIVVQMVPSGGLMVPGSNVMVSNANVNAAYQPEKVTVQPPRQ